MRIGGTPTHRFTIPDEIDLSTLADVQITYSQFDRIILQYSGDDITVSEHVISVTLSQEDTFKFKSVERHPIEIQLRLVFEDGSVAPSNIIRALPQKCLDTNILSLEV